MCLISIEEGFIAAFCLKMTGIAVLRRKYKLDSSVARATEFEDNLSDVSETTITRCVQDLYG